MASTTASHERLADLDFEASVSTGGTNWTFISKPTHPTWENEQTGHRLLIEPAESSFDYRLRLNHESQARPFWTVTELDFAPELIPLVEWVLSAPEADLFNREAVCYLTEPFWEQQDADDASSTQTY